MNASETHRDFEKTATDIIEHVIFRNDAAAAAPLPRSSQNVQTIMQSACAQNKQTYDRGAPACVTRTSRCLARAPPLGGTRSEHRSGRFASISTMLIQNNASEIYAELQQSSSFDIRRASRNSKLRGRRSGSPECRKWRRHARRQRFLSGSVTATCLGSDRPILGP